MQELVSLREEKIQTTPTNQDLSTSLGSLQKFLRAPTSFGHLAALTRSHLIGDHPSGLTKTNKQHVQWTLALK